jgi:hypothetical protein
MFMRFRAAVPFAALFYLLLPLPAFAQTTLSQTSGINPSGTWATFDMTIETNATVNLSSSYYDPQTQTTTSQIPITPPPKLSTSRSAMIPAATLFCTRGQQVRRQPTPASA